MQQLGGACDAENGNSSWLVHAFTQDRFFLVAGIKEWRQTKLITKKVAQSFQDSATKLITFQKARACCVIGVAGWLLC